jgi:capsular polysaccharide biosynthesis protein
MLQPYSSPQQSVYEESGSGFDFAHYIGILKRRVLYFAIPFASIVILGSLIVAIQRPIYHAEGKILVESPEIPADLVRPTVTATANERIQVIEQRIMSRDNLLAIVNKFGLFTVQQQWMSGTQLLDLMRDRTQVKLVDLDSRSRPTSSTIAFTLSFEYESPDLATKVANEFLTLILAEDARTRIGRAAETTKFLEREAKRLEGQLDSVNAQILDLKRRPQAPDVSDQLKSQMTLLDSLKGELIQKSSVYSDQHPDVKNLRKKIATLERAIAKAPPVAATAPVAAADDVAPEVLERQRTSIEASLEEANRKLTTARLGESMETNQQSERLQVIEQPSVPQKPIRPNRLKWFGAAFALAGMAGIGAVIAAEAFDKSIRGSRELAGIIDKQLIVTIPYIWTAAEEHRNRRNLILLCAVFAAVLVAGITVALLIGISVDFSWFDRSWTDVLTRLSQ